jgi:hypothetical protein
VDDGAAEYIKRIGALSNEDEVRLLDDIVEGRYDQGCFLRPEPEELVPATDPDATHNVFAALEDREPVEAAASDPFATTPVPTTAIQGDDAGYVILTQRCDLVRPLVTEPFIELAYTELIHDKQAIDAAKKLSPRNLHVADRADGGAWVTDLRRKVALPKDRLTKYAPVLPIEEERMRKRFKLRAGQRYTRDPLPDDVRDRLRKLVDFLRKNATNMKLSEPFSDFLVVREGEKVRVLAIHPPHIPTKDADDAWAAIETGLGDEYVEEHIHGESGPVSMEDLSFALYIDGWVLDLGDISVNRKASETHEPPNV